MRISIVMPGLRSARWLKPEAGLSLILGRTTWALVDQGIVSLGTFLVSVMLARTLPSSEYGVYALLLATAAALQLPNTSLVAYPLGVRLATTDSEECARLSTSSVGVVAAFSLALSITIVVALFSLGRPDLIAPVVSWFVLSQIQQATRRAHLANLELSEAIAGDLLTYFGQAVVVGVLARAGDLSLAAVLYCMAAAAALGAAVQGIRMPLTARGLHTPHRWVRENASLGGWSLASGLTAVLRGYILFWIVAVLAGPSTVASLQAALNVFFLLNPLLFGLCNLLPQVTTRAYAHGDKRAAWRVAQSYMLVALLPTLSYLAFVLAFSPFVLRVFYGEGSPYLTLGPILPILAVFTGATMMAELIICYFFGVREARITLWVNSFSFIAVAILAVPLCKAFGFLAGASLALATGELVRLGVAFVYLRLLIGSDAPSPTPGALLRRSWPTFRRRLIDLGRQLKRRPFEGYDMTQHLSRAVRFLSHPSEWKHTIARRMEELNPKHLRECKGVIHVGANVGQERFEYAKRRLPVIWIEPIPEIFSQLQRNIAPYPEQSAYRRLITDSDGRDYSFNVASNAGASSSILALGEHKTVWPGVDYVETLAMQSISLDSFMRKEAVPSSKFDTLVLDTQGSELLVLKGGVRTLAKMKWVKVEAADFDSYIGCAKADEIDAFMLGQGFRVLQRTRFPDLGKVGTYYDITYVRETGPRAPTRC